MAPNSGRNPKVKVDRINSLPDEVLELIVSFLPTKCAVGTSILSKRWKYLWTSITSLHFDAYPEDFKLDDFTNFVNKVFRDCNSSHILKLRLQFHHLTADDSHVTNWINEAIKRNVSELDIEVYKLPLSIFSCSTLTVLKLAVDYGVGEIIPSFYLPCLKVLHIEWENLPNGFIEKLIGSCPVLEDLTLGGYLGYVKGAIFLVAPPKSIFIVAPPTLKTLRIQPEGLFWSPPACKIFIKAPNLEYLHLKESFSIYKIIGDFPSLIKANVNIEVDYLGHRHPGFQILKRLSAVKSLSFSSTERIRYGFTLPKFHNLTCLVVITCDHLFWAILTKLIDSSPSLEVLSLEQRVPDNPVLLRHENTWVKPKSVPRCLRYNLATIKIQGLKGRIHDLELLMYYLGNAKVLQRLTINCRGLTQVEEMQFCEQLLKFARASGNCKIHFHGGLSQTCRQPPFWKF